MNLLDRRDWVYLLSLLVPLIVYTLGLKVVGIVSEYSTSGVWGTLRLFRSELLFDVGYVLVWVVLFAATRCGIPRRVVLVLFHASAILVAVIATVAYQYFRSTGTVLDYGMVAYYLAQPEEAQGAVSSNAPMAAWVVLSAALLYALPGPLLITRALVPPRASGSSPEGSPGRPAVVRVEETTRGSRAPERGLTRREFLAAGAGTAAGVFLLKESLLSATAAGRNASFSRAPVSNLVATGLEQSRLEEAAKNVHFESPLANARLKPTLRTRRRHVALIHLESTRERSVTPYKAGIETMPYLAALAKNSLVIERAYTTIPHTSKAITSVNSGLYPSPATDIVEAAAGRIPARCLAELLAEQGYATAWFQSATQTFEDRPKLVANFGYEHFQAFESMKTEGFQRSNYLGYEDDIMLEPSRQWLEENANRPTLVTYLGVTPHDNYLPIERYGRKKFSSRAMLDRYLNNVYYDDFWVKNVIEQYRELGLYEDTIFVIYGDHGEGFDEHGRRGHDGVIWEEGLRIPLVVHDSQRFGGGERLKGPAHLMDFAPTIVDMLGYEVVDGEYPGCPVLELPEDRPLFFGCRPDLLSAARIEGQEKYIYHFGNQPEEFYDLAKDPLEQHNLIARVGREELDRWRQEVLKWHAHASDAYNRN
jgi:lipoteichoic acid synthase